MNGPIRRVFLNDEQQAHFDWNGYVIIEGLFNTHEIEQLREKAKLTLASPHPVFSRTLESVDVELKTLMDSDIRRVLEEKVTRLLDNYKTIVGTFIIKEPGADGLFPLHQNPLFVNEYRFQSMVIWIPLVDVNRENGTLFVAPGTHRLFPTYRGIFDPVSPFQSLNDHIWKEHLVELELKAGQSVLLDDALLHASPPNLSGSTRFAMGGIVVPREAALLQILFEHPEGFPTLMHTYHVDEDHFRLFTNRYREGLNFPKEQLILTTPFIPYPELTPAAFDALVRRRRGIIAFD